MKLKDFQFLLKAALFGFALLNEVAAQDLRLVLPIGHTDEVSSAGFSHDGKYVVTASRDNTAKIWDASTGHVLHSLERHKTDWRDPSAQFSPDCKYVMILSSDRAKIWATATGKLLHSLEGHTDDVNSAEFSPDGKFVVTSSWDKTAKIWGTSTGKELYSLEGHTDVVKSAEFSPDGKLVVTASSDSTAKIWDASTGIELHSLEGHTGFVESAEFSPEGKHVVTTSRDGTAKIWDASTGKELYSLEGHTDEVNSAEFSPDGKYVVTASSDSTAKIWDASTGIELHSLEGHSDWMKSARFSPDGKCVVTSSWDKTAKIWDATTGKELYSLEGHRHIVNSAQFSHDGKFVVTSSWDKTAIIWDASTGKELYSLEGHTISVESAEFSPDGKHILSASFYNAAKIWDASTGIELYSLEGHTGFVESAEFSPEGKHVVTASRDGTAKIWDASTGKELYSLEGHTDEVNSAEFSPDGKYVVTASSDSTAKIWDASTGIELHSLEGHSDWMKSARFSPDGKFVVTASSDETAKIWDAATGEELHSLRHSFILNSAHYDTHGRYVITASWDFTSKIWDVVSGKELHSLEEHSDIVNSAQYSPDGKYVVSSSRDKTAKIWDASTGKELYSLEGHTDEVHSAQFSPDGKHILTASSDNAAKIWDASTGEELHSLEGQTDGVNSAQFSPDGRYVLTTARDHTTKIWDAATGKLLYSRIVLEGGGWLVWDEDYRYDGTPDAIKRMHFVCGLEAIGLEQAKGALYVPNLVARIMAGEDLSALATLGSLDLCGQTPIVTPLPNEGRGYRFQVEPRKGGIVACEVYIDGIQRFNIPAEAMGLLENGCLMLTLSEEEVGAFATNDATDLRVVARCANQLTSRSAGQWVSVPAPRGNGGTLEPGFHGLFVGINDYKGAGLKLNYAAADARELGEVIQAAAQRFFGPERVHVTTLLGDAASGATAYPPEKHRVLAALATIAEQSEAQDILLLHFAGHGHVNAAGEFVFLTSEATSLQEGEFVGITMREINDALMGVKAANRILILDACHSGEAVQDVLGVGALDLAYTKRNAQESRDDVARGRQLERLGSNANLTMLTASASDQAAYELPEIGHGLLTYALLDAIQGHTDVLVDGRFLEVKPWVFQAEKTVNARSAGGNRQRAQTLTPSNYAIGVVDEEVYGMIRIEERLVVKSVILRNRVTRFDDLFLSQQVQEGLRGGGRGGASDWPLFIKDSPRGIDVEGKYELLPDGRIRLTCEFFNASGFLGEADWTGAQEENWAALIAEWVTQKTESP